MGEEKTYGDDVRRDAAGVLAPSVVNERDQKRKTSYGRQTAISRYLYTHTYTHRERHTSRNPYQVLRPLRTHTILPRTALPPAQRPPQDPLLARQGFFLPQAASNAILPLQCIINGLGTLDGPQHDVVLRPGKVHEAVPGGGGLSARWRGDAVHGAAQDTRGELYEGIAEVDDGVAGERANVGPLFLLRRC